MKASKSNKLFGIAPKVQISSSGLTFCVVGSDFMAMGHICDGYAYCDECDNAMVNARDIECLVERTIQ